MRLKHAFYLFALFMSPVALIDVSTITGAQTSTLIVNSSGDTADANPGDGICADASGSCT